MSDSQARQMPENPPTPPSRPDNVGQAAIPGNPLADYGVSNTDYAHAVAIAAAESSVNPPDEEMQGILDVVANRGSFPGQYGARSGSITGIVTARNQFDPVRGAGSSHAGDIYAQSLAHALDPGRNPLPANLQGKFSQAQRAAISVFGTGEARGITNNATFFSNPTVMSAGRIAEHNQYGLQNAQQFGQTHFYGGWSGSTPEHGYSAPIHLGFAPNAAPPPARPGQFGLYGQDRTSAVQRGEVATQDPFSAYGVDRTGASLRGDAAPQGSGRLSSVNPQGPSTFFEAMQFHGGANAGYGHTPPAAQQPSQTQQQHTDPPSVFDPNMMGVPAAPIDRGPAYSRSIEMGRVPGADFTRGAAQEPAYQGSQGTIAQDLGRLNAPEAPASRPAAPSPDFSSYGQDRSSAVHGGRAAVQEDEDFSRSTATTRSAPTTNFTSYGQDRTSAVHSGQVSRSEPGVAPIGSSPPAAVDVPAPPSRPGTGAPTPPSRPSGIGAPTPPSRPDSIGQQSSFVSAPTPPSRPSGIGQQANVPTPPARPAGIGQQQSRLGTVNPVAPPAAQPSQSSGGGGRSESGISYGTGREIGLGGAFMADIGEVFGGPGRTGNQMNERTGDSGGGGGGGSTIICGHYHARGMLDTRIYRADLVYSARFASMRIMMGYWAWAQPLRAYLRRHPDGIIERALRPVVVAASRHMAYRVGAVPRTSMLGRCAFGVLWSLSWVIGGIAMKKNAPA